MSALAAANDLPPTERLYIPSLEGNFTLTSSATLLSFTDTTPTDTETPDEISATVTADLIFDKSPFHPQGGGQPTDIGKVSQHFISFHIHSFVTSHI